MYWKFTMKNGRIFLYESHISGGVQITPYEHLLQAIKDGRVGSIEEFPVDCDPDKLWKECMKYHGDPYDFLQIILYYIWIKVFHRKQPIYHQFCDGRFTCNEFMITTGTPVVPCMIGLDYSYTVEPLYRFWSGHPSRRKGSNYCF